ncbi:MAG TPA: OAM dimerization domain-containing protein [Bacillota bacterium]|nr:OAM dimerization domain-containing protein [Bacillota bacterium]HPF42826.1 OAM dimerization domain-containing protein [Bacillota bacterium]HPJ86350.1 OAM dimerization domain-containing protein [Bacillota bacterium]HPQ62346.1 OAM dimerization domain-containing protein [Bacillota bacterium]HRX91455.1 OAM dimerization domain-containing protein [Candidatus Izemoplasmatales bacterium]
MKIRPYGDTMADGKVETSFTLPTTSDETGQEIARQFAKQMGFVDPNIVHAEEIGEGFSFFVIYGSVPYTVDTDKIKVEKIETPTMTREEIEDLIEKEVGRDVVFVGASTGTDAHTVGIDAIMNMKGFAGHYGLERYKHIRAHNLGSQVPNEEFVRQAKLLGADVLLVSQTVTQKDIHLKNLENLVEILEAENMRNDVILIAGGARITHELAKELGYDAGFGPKKYAEDVASYAITELIKRKNSKN